MAKINLGKWKFETNVEGLSKTEIESIAELIKAGIFKGDIVVEGNAKVTGKSSVAVETKTKKKEQEAVRQ